MSEKTSTGEKSEPKAGRALEEETLPEHALRDAEVDQAVSGGVFRSGKVTHADYAFETPSTNTDQTRQVTIVQDQ